MSSKGYTTFLCYFKALQW